MSVMRFFYNKEIKYFHFKKTWINDWRSVVVQLLFTLPVHAWILEVSMPISVKCVYRFIILCLQEKITDILTHYQFNRVFSLTCFRQNSLFLCMCHLNRIKLHLYVAKIERNKMKKKLIDSISRLVCHLFFRVNLESWRSESLGTMVK